MQLTFDLSRYGIPDGQIVLGGIYNYDTWEPAGPNALSLATLSYYQTFLNKQVELKLGYLNNRSRVLGTLSGRQSVGQHLRTERNNSGRDRALALYAWTTPGINIKVNGPQGFYNKLGIQRASSPDGPFAEKIANPTGLKWSTPNSGVQAVHS